MKRTTLFTAVPVRTSMQTVTIALSVLFQSCIYDAPGDKFYRTLWVSEDSGTEDSRPESETSAQLSSDDSEFTPVLQGTTLEFLCGGSVSISASGAIGSYGTYEHHNLTARFQDLSLTYQINGSYIRIIIEEAHRSNDLLTINWHLSGSSESHATRLVRRSEY